MPSLGYALIYLILIPVFATIYYFLPEHFYHATIQYEKPIEADASKVLEELDKIIHDHFKKAYKGEEPSFKDWKVSFNPSHSLKIDSENVSFVLDFSLVLYGEHSFSTRTFNPIASFSWRRDFINDSYDKNTIHIKQIYIEGLPSYFNRPSENSSNSSSEAKNSLSEANEISRILFPYDYGNNPSNVILMPLTNEINSKITEFAKSAQVIPLKPSGNYVRMFYLSAATITTLGYGDIVPLTTTSRLLVSIEAILGIVIIGLFLNALAHERDAIK